MKNVQTKTLLTLLVAVLMIAAVFTVLPIGLASAKPEAAPAAAPAAALKNTRTILLYSGSGITASANGSAVYTGGYAGADCYNTIDVGSAQTVTMIISHSVDAQNWVTGNTFTAVSADGTAFTNTVPYGLYFRAAASLAGSNAVTVTARCVLKD